SAGHISTDEAKTLITDLAEALDDIEGIRFYTGVSYRHLFVVSEMDFDITTQPPHDIIGKKIVKNLPKGKNADFLNDIMARSQQLFDNHQINRVRKDLDENAASSVWFWGQGRKAALERFSTRFGLKGAAITAVDLVRGLAKLIGFDLIEVEGATGYIDTNYQGKAEAAIEALNDYDIVFVHVEAPDEAGHAGNAAAKMRALEDIDEYIVGPVYEAIKQYDSYRILVMPDHPTPVATQAHSDEPVPFAIAGTGMEAIVPKPFSEKNALDSGFSVEKGHELMEYFLKV
ncbi:MAG: phosphoglycerate mutase, partial [Planctomycetes bacterium]|nr:phosphoglycerate mutase [Planctomycetota bacterium]